MSYGNLILISRMLQLVKRKRTLLTTIKKRQRIFVGHAVKKEGLETGAGGEDRGGKG